VERKIWTADELAAMSPAERDAIFQASIVRDLRDVRPEFLERIRQRAADYIEATEGQRPTFDS
jgi:hypothetical protein